MASKIGKILVVDDNVSIRQTLKLLLPMYFEKVETIPSPSTLIATIGSFKPDVVLLDMNFKTEVNTGNEGLYWLREIKEIAPNVEVVLFTAYADIELAVEGMKRGAFDFIVKPWNNEKLVSILTAACNKSKKEKSSNQTKSEIIDKQDKNRTPSKTQSNGMFWGGSQAMAQIRRIVEKTAPTDAVILITGENGTGKDVMAREIHALSLRSDKPMVAVDAGAIPETLFESELFGYMKGAFTDARTDHAGKFEQADGGTLFLDEIGNIPLHLQAKLLRALQSRSIVRVGGTQEKPIDIRLICATNMNLELLVHEGRFREDLFYRINTVHIELPPLRDRSEDILPLAERFMKENAEKYHRQLTEIDVAAQKMLLEHRWSGNIRELQNCIEKAVIMSESEILTIGDLQLNVAKNEEFKLSEVYSDEDEEQLIKKAVTRSRGNLSAAAKMLNISRPTLYSKIKKYGL